MGFLGFGNYAKPGKGVKKGEAEKKRLFQFTELYFRKFYKIIQLNLLFVVFCIPSMIVGIGGIYVIGSIVTDGPVFAVSSVILGIIAAGLTGPATAAMMRIARYYVEEKPVFLMSDFTKALKSNFMPALVVGLINATLTYILFQSFLFYYLQTTVSMWYWIPLALILFIAVLAVLTNFYIYLAMVSVDLKLRSLLKNCVSFAFLGAKTNFITLFFVLLIVVPSVLFLWITTPLFLLIIFSTVSMIVAFNSFQYIYKYSIRPYYLINGLEDPYEVKEDLDDVIFEDRTV